jgi:hypothetical protein
MPGANIMRQGEIPLRLLHVAPIEITVASPSWEKLLRLAGFPGPPAALVEISHRHRWLAVALMNLSKHNQRNRQMLPLVQCTIDLDSLLGSRYAFDSAYVAYWHL